MKLKLLLFFLFITACGFAQGGKLKVLKGIIVSDSVRVERVTVTNLTQGTFSVSDDLGQFSIFAIEGDNLVFSSVVFESVSVILKAADFQRLLFKVELNVNVNQLDEVKIGAFKLSGDLTYDAKRIKVKPVYKIDLPKIDFSQLEITGVKDRVLSPIPGFNQQPLGGINFVSIAKAVFNTGSSKKERFTVKTQISSSEAFVNTIKKSFSDSFFTNTLKVKEEEVGRFLNFCTTDERKEKWLLKPENQLALVDYLTKKGEEFNKIND
jgi:hypothetical protein